VNDLSGVDPNRTILEIPDTRRLPDCCISCGISTRRRVEILQKRDLDKEPTLKNFMAHLIVTASAPVYMTAKYGDMDGTTPTVLLKVPQCLGCAMDGKPQPFHVDFDKMSMSFVVHKNFKKKAERTPKRSAG
jgi:hypothetical protein